MLLFFSFNCPNRIVHRYLFGNQLIFVDLKQPHYVISFQTRRTEPQKRLGKHCSTGFGTICIYSRVSLLFSFIFSAEIQKAQPAMHVVVPVAFRPYQLGSDFSDIP